MADAYPWGAQAPAARLTKLEGTLQKSIGAKDRYLEGHRLKLAEFEDAERKLKADIRACEAVVEKERIEAQSNQFTKILTKIAGSGAVDLSALLADPDLEKKLAAIAQANSKNVDKKPAKSPTKASGSDDDNAGADGKAP